MKKSTLFTAILAALTLSAANGVAANGNNITYVAENGEEMSFVKESEDLFGGLGSFDTKESLNHFTTGGYIKEGDPITYLSEASDYWRFNDKGYVEMLASGGSTKKSSMLTYVPLNDGEEIGEEKMYYFSMRVYTEKAKQLKITWNATKSAKFWSSNSGTEYGGRYPDYGSSSIVADSDKALDNNASIYTKGGWQTVDGYMIAKKDAKYFMLNCRYMQGSTSSPTCIDDIVLYEIGCADAASELFVNDYIVYDSLPEIDGVWTDEKGFVKDGVFTRPEIGGIDTITANYADGTKKTFTVEVIGKKTMDSDGGNYNVCGKNLIKNASFEYYETDNRENGEGETYPFFYTWESTITGSDEAGINNAENGCFAINHDRFVTGKTSMRVRYSDAYNNHSSFNQFVTLPEDGLYYVSYYARRSTSDKRNLEVRINGDCVHSFNTQMLTPEWKKYSCVIDAKGGDTFEFTGYNISSVYVDSFVLVRVEKENTNCMVVLEDENGNTLREKTVENLAYGSKYAYDYSTLENIDGELFVYKNGDGVIDSLKADNKITLVYEKVTEAVVEDVAIKVPHHTVPSLPKSVKCTINGKDYVLDAVWDEADESLTQNEGNTFTINGVVGGAVETVASVKVVKNYNYLDGRLSTADFSTIKKAATDANKVEISFDILPLKSKIDASLGFTADNVTVDAWNSCGVTIRLYTDGRFQYCDGDKGFVQSNVFYRSNTAYNVRIFVNFEDKTYSAYVSQKGSEYNLPVCENASFRAGSADMKNIGQMLARGGSGSSAGEFKVGNISWGNVNKLSLIKSYKGDDGMRHVLLCANETGNSKIYYADYTDGYFGELYTEEISYTQGETVTLLLENADNKKLMMIDDLLVPDFNAIELDEHGDESFVSSFMGSFAFYQNSYNSDIVDDDPGIVQVNILEIYSDRITLTTRNYGEHTGDAKNPTPSVFKRHNGDDSQTDTPIKRVLVFGDYQISDYLLSDESLTPLRPVFVKVCEDLEKEHFDAVMVGGDLTFWTSVSKERWELVVDTVLGMLKEKISPNIYIIAGNHDYNAGERDNYNSADYYNTYMKENNGSLEENGNGYFEHCDYYDEDVLIAFMYEQDGIYFMGLSTSPTMMRGNLQYSNYNYTEGAMDWIENKLKEIGPDKTVLFTSHFPLSDSNNIVKSSKGASEDTTLRLIDIFKNYPNLVHLYGHDHGSAFAFINSETEERVTRYDTDGYKID